MRSLVSTNSQPGSTDLRFSAPPHDLGDGTVEVADIWRLLWRRRRWIIATVAVLTAVTLLYCVLTPPLFSATAQILVDPRDRPLVASEMNAGSVAPDGGVTQAATQASVVKSSRVLLRAIAATKLTDDREFSGASFIHRFISALLGRPALRLSTDGREARTLAALRRHVTVKRAAQVLVLNVTVSARHPGKAAQLANAIAKAYLVEQADARAEAAHKVSAQLTARLAAQRKRVLAAANAVQRYKAAHNMVAATGELVSERQLAEVNRELTAAQGRTAQAKAEIDQIAHARAAGASAAIPEVIQSPLISKLREQEATLVEREAALASQVGPRYPALTAVRSQLRHVRQVITVELDRIATAAMAKYTRAVATQQALSAKLQRLKTQTLSTDQASIDLKDLERNLHAVRAVYAASLLRVQRTSEQANVSTTGARIISLALPPLHKSWPPTLLLLVGAAMAGLGLGAGMALLVESVAPAVLSVRQAEALSDAPVIGILPAERDLHRRRLGGATKDAKTSLDPGAIEPDPTAHVAAVTTMALRRLFEAASRSRNSARSIVVTSGVGDAQDRERVTRLLAATAASQGERVLLVDADLARDQQSSAAGLLDVLRGECSFESVVYFEKGSMVALVTKGRRQTAGPEGRAGPAFARRMLIEARHHFDLVVVNGGAVAENLIAAPLAMAADEVLMIARLDATLVRDVKAATEALSIMGRRASAALLVDSATRG